jgi:H+/Cl- antiporter ClcA
MATTPASPESAASSAGDTSRADIGRVLGSAALVAIPVSIAAYLFTQLIDNSQDALWVNLPDALGFDAVPWWWPIPLLLVGGLLLSGVVLLIPGRAGNPPAEGFELVGLSPALVLPVLLGALASLPFGAVLGPEMPLTVLGAGGAVWLARLVKLSPTGQAEALVLIAGAGAAVATILGNPLVAIIFIVEAAAVAGAPMRAVVLPTMTSIGIGTIVFTGLGSIDGIDEATLSAPPFTGDVSLDLADVLYAIPIGLVAGVVMTVLFAVGKRLAHTIGESQGRRVVVLTVSAAVFVGACAAAYALITDRSPQDVASSGTETIGELLAEPASWGIGALVAVLVFKAFGYMVSLGALRGGPVFPGVFLGVAFGVLIAPLPGLGLAAAVSGAVAAFSSAGLKLPLSATALALLLVGASAPDQLPVMIVAAVVGFLVRLAIEQRIERRAASAEPATA